MGGNEMKTTESVNTGTVAEKKSTLKTIGVIWKKFNPIIIFIIFAVIASLISPEFRTERNIFNVLRQYSVLGIVCMGMFYVIVTGGIDLSVGSIMALGCVLMGIFINQFHSILVAALMVCLVGLVLGTISGIFVSVFKIAPFVMTLAMMLVAHGFAFIFSNGNPILIPDHAWNDIIQGTVFQIKGSFLGISIPFIMLLVIFAITLFVFRKTFYGRLLIAIGSNEEAVRLSGIRVNLYKLIAYTISGILAAYAGAMMAGRTSIGSPLVGDGEELNAIAAIVIGGASLQGGKGSVLFTLLGVYILAIISNILNMLNIQAYPQEVIMGCIIVVAVLFQSEKTGAGFLSRFKKTQA
jgi:ribose transport system permease protein